MTNLLKNLYGKAKNLFSSSVTSFESNPEAEQAAVAAACIWLTLIDEQKYEESWEKSSPERFQNVVPKDEWVQKSRGIREPLGTTIKRALKSAKYAKSLPGTADGEYVVVKFNTQFENKKHAIETVTFVKNRSWKACGCFIK